MIYIGLSGLFIFSNLTCSHFICDLYALNFSFDVYLCCFYHFMALKNKKCWCLVVRHSVYLSLSSGYTLHIFYYTSPPLFLGLSKVCFTHLSRGSLSTLHEVVRKAFLQIVYGLYILIFPFCIYSHQRLVVLYFYFNYTSY